MVDTKELNKEIKGCEVQNIAASPYSKEHQFAWLYLNCSDGQKVVNLNCHHDRAELELQIDLKQKGLWKFDKVI